MPQPAPASDTQRRRQRLAAREVASTRAHQRHGSPVCSPRTRPRPRSTRTPQTVIATTAGRWRSRTLAWRFGLLARCGVRQAARNRPATYQHAGALRSRSLRRDAPQTAHHLSQTSAPQQQPSPSPTSFALRSILIHHAARDRQRSHRETESRRLVRQPHPRQSPHPRQGRPRRSGASSRLSRHRRRPSRRDTAPDWREAQVR